MFFKIRTSEGTRLMPTLPRFDRTFESGKLAKDLPVNSRFFFVANLSAFCRVCTSANAAILMLRRSSLFVAAGTAVGTSADAAILMLRRSSLFVAAGTAAGTAKVVEVGDVGGEETADGGAEETTAAAASGPPSSTFGWEPKPIAASDMVYLRL